MYRKENFTSIIIHTMTNHIHRSLQEKEAECKGLLRSTGRPGIEGLISHIERMGYFMAPGSENHHRFEGGLVSHSLETYKKAMELRERKIKSGVDASLMPQESVIIAALMHDICKADALRFNASTRKVYKVKNTNGHSARSVRQVGYSHFVLTKDEEDAILWHMGGSHLPGNMKDHFKSHPLADIIYHADRKSIHEASQRHHSKHANRA